MNKIYNYLLNRLEQEKRTALVTIILAEGSTPQKAGASALFSERGLIQGTIGGGVVEAAVQKKIRSCFKKNMSCVCEFNLDKDTAPETGAVCGGQVKVLIDTFPERDKNIFHELCWSLDHKRRGILEVRIKGLGEKRVSISRAWIEEGEKIPALMKKLLSRGNPELHEKEGEKDSLFLEPVCPSEQLVIAGAGHIGQAVAHLGSLLNFEVTVIDDRPEYANKKKLPDADHIIVEDIGKALKNFPITPDTYLVIVTRGHRHDADALRGCIGSEAAYIGMIGSDEKVKYTRNQFLKQAWATQEQLSRVHAPIGLPINSQTVDEIAVSIAAELVMVRSQVSERGRKS
jgi:xanthine dehydrogenase accessory factor